ncbi:MAG: cytochrome c peroxidase [Verrucomicrobiales bacterium]
MKAIRFRNCLAAAFLLVCPLPWLAPGDTGNNPVDKPEKDRPDTFEELDKDPRYKRAQLMISPESPLDVSEVEEGNDPALSDTRWNWHKNAMHLKALKRSGQDHPDLRQVITRLLPPEQGGLGPALGSPESGFEKVTMPGGETLTVFRFTNFDSFIRNDPKDPTVREKALQDAIALGKAFFWDVRFGSDRQTACATCHYAAGADQRLRSNVGLPANFGMHLPLPNFGRPEGAVGKGSKAVLDTRDLAGADLANGEQPGTFDPETPGIATREVVGSIGISRHRFDPRNPDTLPENATQPSPEIKAELEAEFRQILTIETSHRQVTPRNAPSVINAVFNARNFWDGRADPVFNGRTFWGLPDYGTGKDADDKALREALTQQASAGLVVFRREGGEITPVKTWKPYLRDPFTFANRNPYYIANASLASQALGPIVSDVEMSHRGRQMHHIARRMLDEKILGDQSIHGKDSSLGIYEKADERPTYRELLAAVFKSEWLSSAEVRDIVLGDFPNQPAAPTQPYSMTEANFGLFWGLAIHIYESTLISDDSRFDQHQRSIRTSGRAAVASEPLPETKNQTPVSILSASERRGFELFRTLGCADCHSGAEFTAASATGEIGLLMVGEDPLGPKPAPILEEDEPKDCPQGMPRGVECMGLGDDLQSIYDGGHYVIGASRYERLPRLPTAPRNSRGRGSRSLHIRLELGGLGRRRCRAGL